MKKEKNAVRTISFGLVLVYAVSLVFSRRMAGGDMGAHAVILMFVFGLLLVSSLATAGLQNWGRKSLMLANAGFVLYLLFLYLIRMDIVFMTYAFLSCIVVLYYGQDKTRVAFVADKALTRRSVLIVDDDPALIKTIKPLLLNKGYSVLSANTGEKGLQIAQKQKPDLIILDVILPGIKGREVCQKLKEDEATQRIPVIFLTAKDSPDDVKAELEVGALTHITKPFSAHKLLEEISKALN